MATTASSSTWQEQCTHTLKTAVEAGRSGCTEWETFRVQMLDQTRRIIIADASFDGLSLANFDLSRCYIIRTTFRSANLSGANFSQSIFRQCDATDANIEGAKFRAADMQVDGLSLMTKRFDSETEFEVEANHLPDNIHPGLRNAAVRARHERLWRNRKSYSWTVRAMLWLTQHGFSLCRLACVGVAIVALFALLYWRSGSTIAVLTSVGYFLSLNSTFPEGWLLAAGSLESLIGMLFFAVLTAILISMFYDKN